MATIRKRTKRDGSPVYQVQIRVKGLPQQTATFDRLTDARRWAEQAQADLRRNRHVSPDLTTLTVHDLIDRYRRDVLPQKPKAVRVQDPQLLWWDETIGQVVLRDLTPGTLAQARDRLVSIRHVRFSLSVSFLLTNSARNAGAT